MSNEGDPPIQHRQTLTEHAEQLGALGDDLAHPLRDRDPLLWAAHESVLCAQTLINVRLAADTTAPGYPTVDLREVLNSARSALVSVRYAVTDSHDR